MKNFIIIDLEWNQSPSGKVGANEKLPFEVIEMGAVKLDESFYQIDEFRSIIKPQVYNQIHYKILEVTHMTFEELLENGNPFEQVIKEFLTWCGPDSILCTWGAMDLTELQRNIEYYNLENPFPKPLFYYDIQKFHSLLYDDGKSRHSLDSVVNEMGIQVDRPFHRALDDAYYTAKVLKKMDFDKVKSYVSVDYFRPPLCREEEIYMEFRDYSKFVSMVYETKEDAIEDKAVTATACYLCKRMLRKKIHWFSNNTKFYFCLAICPEHGYLKGKIRMKKTDEGNVFAVRTLKLVGEEDAKGIRQRQEELRKRRAVKRKKGGGIKE